MNSEEEESSGKIIVSIDRKSLECAVCFTMPPASVLQCRHIYCPDCYKRLKICGLCREPMAAKGIRSLAVEELVGSIPAGCPNTDCDFEGNAQALRDHRKTCGLRQVPCPDWQCPRSVCKARLLAHLRLEHLNVGEEISDGRVVRSYPVSDELELEQPDLSWSDSALKLVHFGGLQFLPQLVKIEGTYYTWLCALASADVADRFSAGITVYGATEEDLRVAHVDLARQDVLMNSKTVLSFGNMCAKIALNLSSAGESEIVRSQPRPRIPGYIQIMYHIKCKE